MSYEITTSEEFELAINEKDAVLFYFSHDECSVCKVLKPKLIELLEKDFSKIEFCYIDIKNSPEIAAQKSIFTVPTILVYFDGREFVRKSRNLNFAEFVDELSRPYQMLFV